MSEAPATPPVAGPRLLANRNFLKIFTAGAISLGGQSFSSLAIVWVVYARTGSALDVAWVGVAGLAGSLLLTLPAGAWVDRYPRRSMMVLSDVLRGGCSVLLALVLTFLGFSLLTVLTVAFAWAAGGSLFNPAEQSFLPSLVRPEQIADANGLIQSSRSLSSLFGNVAAGILIAVAGATPSFWVNAGTFAASAALVVGVRLPAGERTRAATRERALLREMREGMRWLFGEPGLFQLSLSAGPLNFFNSLFGAFLVVFVVSALHQGAFVLGLLGALLAFGYATGSLLVGRTKAVHYAGRVWVLSYGLGCGAAILAFSRSPTVYVALPLCYAVGVLSSFAGTTWLSTAQSLVPSEFRGRYFSLDGMLSFGVLPAADVVGGLLIDAWGVRATFLFAGAGMIAVALLFLPARALAHWGVPVPAPPS